MRALILVAATSLAMSACGPKPGADNAVATGDNLAAEAIIANDTTAIDAATGDAANIAADVDYSVNQVSDDGSDVAAGSRAPTRRRATESAGGDNASDNSTEAVETNGA